MKKISVLVLALFLGLGLNAQILKTITNGAINQAKKSATNKASEKVNNEVDKGVNKLFDSVFKEDSTKKEQPAATQQTETSGGGNGQTPALMGKLMKKMGVSTEDVPHKAEYKFTGQMTMLLENTNPDGEKEPTSELTTSINEENNDVLFCTSTKGQGEMTNIIDNENTCMLNLINNGSEKTGMATKFDPANGTPTIPVNANSSSGNNESTENDCTLTKTGNTKKISGFNCEEYKCDGKEQTIVAWVTKDFSSDNEKILSRNPMKSTLKQSGFDGMLIRHETYSKNDKSSSIFTLSSIDLKKNSSFSTTGYKITGLSFSQPK